MNKKNTGCIYTKKWIVDMMLDICGYTPNKDLYMMTVVEPSCGEGSFVIEIADRLCKSLKNKIINMEDLGECIKAYDIDKEALKIVRSRTSQLLSSYGLDKTIIRNLIDKWFVDGDFIMSDVHDADLVIGNPPYIRSTDISKDTRFVYSQSLNTFSFGTDIYIAFMEKGVRSLKETGKLCFICSDRWQKNQSGAKFRNFLHDSDLRLSFNCQMHDVEAFESDVTAYPSISILQHGEGRTVNIECNASFNEHSARMIVDDYNKGTQNQSANTFFYTFADHPKGMTDFPMIQEAGILVGIGIATGNDKIFITEDPTIVEKSRLIPLAYARDIKDYHFPTTPAKWLVNPWDHGSLVDLDDFPMLRKYFYTHEEELRGRHVARKNPDTWFRTIDKVNDGLEQQEKLLIRDMSQMTEPIYEGGNYYPHHNLYWMTSATWDIEVLGGILISDIVYKMMEQNSVKMRGGVIRHQAQYLRKLRVPHYLSISDEDKLLLKNAFRNRDRSGASIICERLYG